MRYRKTQILQIDVVSRLELIVLTHIKIGQKPGMSDVRRTLPVPSVLRNQLSSH